MKLNQLWSELIKKKSVQQLIELALVEDLSNGITIPAPLERGDITSDAIFTTEDNYAGVIQNRQPGIICGLHLAQDIFFKVDSNLKVELLVEEGSYVEEKQPVLKVSGSVEKILIAERPALNFLIRLCGIATQAYKTVSLLPEGSKTEILDTRKTMPGWREIEKLATLSGGATNHRMGLYDQFLVKDNHIAAAGSIAKALEKVHAYKKEQGINALVEIEVDSLEQMQEILNFEQHLIPNIILLDNMNNQIVAEAIKIRNTFSEKGGPYIQLEASGGITQERIKELGALNVDRISMGALTHTVQPLDLGMDFQS